MTRYDHSHLFSFLHLQVIPPPCRNKDGTLIYPQDIILSIYGFLSEKKKSFQKKHIKRPELIGSYTMALIGQVCLNDKM